MERNRTRSKLPVSKTEKLLGGSNTRSAQSRTEYVAAKKAAGKTVKPRSLEKKGWGKNAPVKKKLIP